MFKIELCERKLTVNWIIYGYYLFMYYVAS